MLSGFIIIACCRCKVYSIIKLPYDKLVTKAEWQMNDRMYEILKPFPLKIRYIKCKTFYRRHTGHGSAAGKGVPEA